MKGFVLAVTASSFLFDSQNGQHTTIERFLGKRNEKISQGNGKNIEYQGPLIESGNKELKCNIPRRPILTDIDFMFFMFLQEVQVFVLPFHR